jgi:hypothetical protein
LQFTTRVQLVCLRASVLPAAKNLQQRNLRHSETTDFNIDTLAPFQKQLRLACEAGSPWRACRDNITRPRVMMPET